MTRREQQHAYESAVGLRDMFMSSARALTRQRWDAIHPGARERLERDIRHNVKRARKANQEARRIWNER